MRALIPLMAAGLAACAFAGSAAALPEKAALQIPDSGFRDAFGQEIKIYPGQELAITVAGDIDIWHRYYTVSRRSGFLGMGRTTELREEAAWRKPSQHGIELELTWKDGKQLTTSADSNPDETTQIRFTTNDENQIVFVRVSLSPNEQRSIASLTQYRTIKFRIRQDGVAQTKCESQRSGVCSKGTYQLELKVKADPRLDAIAELLRDYVDAGNVARSDLLDEVTTSDAAAADRAAILLVGHALRHHAVLDDRIVVLERARAIAPSNLLAGGRLMEAYIAANRFASATKELQAKLADARAKATSPAATPKDILLYENQLKQALTLDAKKSVFDVPGDLQRATQSGISRLDLLGRAMRTMPYDLQYSIGYGEAAIEVAGLHTLIRDRQLLRQGSGLLAEALRRLPYRYPGELIGSDPEGERIVIGSYARRLNSSNPTRQVGIGIFPYAIQHVVASVASPKRPMFVLGSIDATLGSSMLWTPSAPSVAPLPLSVGAPGGKRSCESDAIILDTIDAQFAIEGYADWPLLIVRQRDGKYLGFDPLRRTCSPLATQVGSTEPSLDDPKKFARPAAQASVAYISSRISSDNLAHPELSVLYQFSTAAKLRKYSRKKNEGKAEQDGTRRNDRAATEEEPEVEEYRLALWIDPNAAGMTIIGENAGLKHVSNVIGSTADGQAGTFFGIEAADAVLENHTFVAVAPTRSVGTDVKVSWARQSFGDGPRQLTTNKAEAWPRSLPVQWEYTVAGEYQALAIRKSSSADSTHYCISQIEVGGSATQEAGPRASYTYRNDVGTIQPCSCSFQAPRAAEAKLLSVPIGGRDYENFVVVGVKNGNPSVYRTAPAQATAGPDVPECQKLHTLGNEADGQAGVATNFPRIVAWLASVTRLASVDQDGLQVQIIRAVGERGRSEQDDFLASSSKSVLLNYELLRTGKLDKKEPMQLTEGFPASESDALHVVRYGSGLLAMTDHVHGWVRALRKAHHELHFSAYQHDEQLVRSPALVLPTTGVVVLPVRTSKNESRLKLIVGSGLTWEEESRRLFESESDRLRVSPGDAPLKWFAVGRPGTTGVADQFAAVGVQPMTGHVKSIVRFEVLPSLKGRISLHRLESAALPDNSNWRWVSVAMGDDVPFVDGWALTKETPVQVDAGFEFDATRPVDEQWLERVEALKDVEKASIASRQVYWRDWDGQTWDMRPYGSPPGARLIGYASTGSSPSLRSHALLQYAGGLVLTSTAVERAPIGLVPPSGYFDDSLSIARDMGGTLIMRAFRAATEEVTYYVMGGERFAALDGKSFKTERKRMSEWNSALLTDRAFLALNPAGDSIVFDAGNCMVFAETAVPPSGDRSSSVIRIRRDFPLGGVGGVPAKLGDPLALREGRIDLPRLDESPVLAMDYANYLAGEVRNRDVEILDRLDPGITTNRWLLVELKRQGLSSDQVQARNEEIFCATWPDFPEAVWDDVDRLSRHAGPKQTSAPQNHARAPDSIAAGGDQRLRRP